jgi:hypothetical protein
MNPDAITPQLLKHALDGWRRGRRLPERLLWLEIANSGVSTRSARELAVVDYLHALTTTQLATYRRMFGIVVIAPVETVDGLLDQLRRDFNGASCRELQAWSAVYSRFLAPITLSTVTLAQAVGVSDRHFRRIAKTGLFYLTVELARDETSKRNSPLDAPR